MPNILFVCSANRFRSVIAAGCFQSLLQQNKLSGDWQVGSAGIWARNGAPPLREALTCATQLGLNLESTRSREINQQLVDEADLVIAMTRGQVEAITCDFPGSVGKTVLLSEVCKGNLFDIPDPVLSTDEDPGEIAREIYNLLVSGFPRILERVKYTLPTGTTLAQPNPLPPATEERIEKSPRRSWRWLFWVLLAILLLAVGLYLLWTNPFFGKRLPQFTGAPIQTFTPLPAVSSEIAATAIAVTQQPVAPVPGRQETEPVVSQSDAVCGQTEPMFILGLGIDEVEQADVIRLMRVDFAQRRALILSIPRDFWVPIPGLEEYDISQFRINAAYGYGEYFNGRGQGVVKFSETVYQNYGITFDHYGAIHFNTLEQLVDALGGVDFYLDGPIGAYGYKGYHHLDGEQVLEFVRERQADLDRYRIMRQSVIIDALVQKLRQPEYLKQIPELGIKVIKDKGVVTDLTLRDIYTFMCFIQEIDENSLVFKDIPLDLYTPMITNYGRHIKVPKPEATIYIQDLLLNGNY